MLWKSLKEKEKLDEKIESMKPRLLEPPVPFPENLSELQNMELRKVQVRGHFDYTHEVYLGPRSGAPETGLGTGLPGQKVTGVHAITPFKLADRDLTILVNRGWYQMDKFETEESRKQGQVHGEQEIVGVVRLSQPEPKGFWSWTTDVNKPMRRFGCDVYVYRNVMLLAERCGTAPVFIDGIMDRPSPAAPKPVQPSIELSTNKCIQDIFVWLMLGFVCLFYWLRAYRVPARPSTVHDFLNKQEARYHKKS